MTATYVCIYCVYCTSNTWENFGNIRKNRRKLETANKTKNSWFRILVLFFITLFCFFRFISILMNWMNVINVILITNFNKFSAPHLYLCYLTWTCENEKVRTLSVRKMEDWKTRGYFFCLLINFFFILWIGKLEDEKEEVAGSRQMFIQKE